MCVLCVSAEYSTSIVHRGPPLHTLPHIQQNAHLCRTFLPGTYIYIYAPVWLRTYNKYTELTASAAVADDDFVWWFSTDYYFAIIFYSVVYLDCCCCYFLVSINCRCAPLSKIARWYLDEMKVMRGRINIAQAKREHKIETKQNNNLTNLQYHNNTKAKH